jgi:hypothetical protein
MIHNKDQKKNRYKNRESFSKEYLETLSADYSVSKKEFTNPFTNKKYENIGNLKRSLAMKMSEESLHYYIFLITKPECDVCKNEITDYIDYCKRSFRCQICTYNSNGKIKKVWSKEARKSANEKISKRKKEYAKSSAGKENYKKVGKRNSEFLKEYFQTTEGKEQIENSSKKQSATMKKKIRNGEFTPNITNTWTNWDAIIYLDNGDVKKFRSSWEAAFWYSNQHLKFEYMRIPYILEGEMHVYIADFFDEETNTVYEIKPKGQWLNQNNKMQKAITYCLENNIDFVWINEYNIMKYIKKEIFFDENLKQLEKMMSGVIHYDEIENQKH